jgi:hypothetical protein
LEVFVGDLWEVECFNTMLRLSAYYGSSTCKQRFVIIVDEGAGRIDDNQHHKRHVIANFCAGRQNDSPATNCHQFPPMFSILEKFANYYVVYYP